MIAGNIEQSLTNDHSEAAEALRRILVNLLPFGDGTMATFDSEKK